MTWGHKYYFICLVLLQVVARQICTTGTAIICGLGVYYVELWQLFAL